ncbi:DNA ligase [Candidatus Roizmanbacteria bacterium CG06_land_8_20_14_3_00_34_14]|uniref:Probable DNA ligase n=3 Tax=Candidatus Roizmaniibacteriota TaxID=1752723 RepID=A0A2M7AUN3_9BACT|nr:MAG: DNA ligase [Candidatus Roizmanbacteria bacterium CG07_land_8_20_14_0_80_34_15]PIU74340.1 MAG: DNA ligase [Candidatus Roizmanbacteria bacterium CG06_land_8_20_14_3_00_34_14]
MFFSELSRYFEKIEGNSSRLEITRILAELFNKLNSQEIAKVVYLLQGRVGPAYEGIDFGMAERTIIKSAMSALNIDRSYFEKEFKKSGDLGATVESFKKIYTSFEEKDMEVLTVFDFFYRLATATGNGSQDIKTSLLAQLIRQLDPLSGRYLVRLPTGIIRLGFSDMTVLDAYSWMLTGDKSLRPVIETAYHVRPDLGFIGKILKEKGVDGLKEIGPEVFTPIIMMKAERMSSAKEIIKQIGKCLVEPKFDGFRLQVHYLGSDPRRGSDPVKSLPKVRLFSRSLEDVTFMYPDIVEGVKREVKADELIIEGEAIGYNPKTGEFLPFQETVQRKRKYDIGAKAIEVPLKLFAFELLYLNGKNFIKEPFFERRNALEKVTIKNKDISKQIIVVDNQEEVDKEKRLEEIFESAISKKLEGVIAKKIDGVYQPGARGWNWIKYKRSYSSRINDTIDCLVMGYDFGKGKRADFGMGAFLVGVLDEKKDKFVTVAKIGTGLTDKEWKKLWVMSNELRIKEKPKNYLVDKQAECDVWIMPKIVVEIKADEITKSPTHTADLALRFPRLERFRDDKKSGEVTTLEELQSMVRS